MFGRKKKKPKNTHENLKHPKDKSKFVRGLKKFWYFIWYEDSILSWLANIVLAFILIKFIIYPGLGLIFGTSFPVVAVVSSSMEHPGSFDEWWQQEAFCGDITCGPRCICSNADWYRERNITKEDFKKFRFHNGFNKGDIMVLFGVSPEDVRPGDVLVYDARRPVPTYPIIHRTLRVRHEEKYYFETKGDNNKNSIVDTYLNEKAVSETQLLGKAVLRIPWLGYVKICATTPGQCFN
jgi:signal peptidase I